MSIFDIEYIKIIFTYFIDKKYAKLSSKIDY